MSKLKKFNHPKIKKISGGRDPGRLIEEFISRRGFDPAGALRQRTGDAATWCVQVTEDEELEITVEGINRPAETTLYLGMNILLVPLKQCERYLAAALIVADRLIGAKISLVSYDFVLSITNYLGDRGVEEIDLAFELLLRQKDWVREEIIQEAQRSEYED